MAAVVGSDERFGSGTMALLPWARQKLGVLWEQLRQLLQVIYYTFMSVFLRFEVHVRITDETGQHIQHMSTAASPPESFLFSSLFDGDGGMMVGGSNPLANFCADSPFSMKSKTSGKELGHQSSWNIFVSSNDGSSSSDSCDRSGERAGSEEDRSSQWSSEEDQNLVEFHNEEAKALWESLSRSGDPYNPFFFSACISTNKIVGKEEHRETDLRSGSVAAEEMLGPTGLKMWVSRSDSESSWSSSDGSSVNMDEDTECLLEFFSSPDPYNPMCFSACTGTKAPPPAPPPRLHTETENSPPPSSEGDEEEQLWKSLCSEGDHPQARLHSALKTPAKFPASTKTSKPSLPVRHVQHHCLPDRTLVPWKRPGQTKKTDGNPSSAQKKVQFSPLVQVHVMRSWSFARQASRKGHWEEMARDRDRFRRRIQETERSIGHCFSAAHRKRMQLYLNTSCLH